MQGAPRTYAFEGAPRQVREVAAAGVAAAVADGILNPSTVLQVKQQIEPTASTLQLARRAISKHGILMGLWLPGLPAISMRALTYSGFRVGRYPTVKEALPGDDGFRTRVLDGAITGGVGGFTFAPMELVRVRMVGPAPYSTTAAAFASIVRNDTFAGLWRGASAFALRCACFSGAQLATYDTCKRWLLRGSPAGAESPRQHVLASMVSGVCAQVVCHPVDTLKTLVMSASVGAKGGASACSPSVAEVAIELASTTSGGAVGMLGRVYSGLLPAILSRGPMVMIFLPLVEQIRTRVFGLGYL